VSVIWKGLQVTFGLFLIAGLAFASSVFGVLLYAKITGNAWFEEPVAQAAAAVADANAADSAASGQQAAEQASEPEPPKSVLIEAPIVRQRPELPAGCEVTSLTMLLQFSGISKTKLELADEMKKDPTPIRYNKDGSIAYWGNPNTGFVGDVTRKSIGFGIYHTALFELLEQYIPAAVDLTRKPFEDIEEHLRKGVPVVVWTTIDFQVPSKWVTWDTPVGPIRTTFKEHAVLLVGYDEQHVYVNDPYSGKANYKLNKEQFVQTWEAMGRQAITYLPAS